VLRPTTIRPCVPFGDENSQRPQHALEEKRTGGRKKKKEKKRKKERKKEKGMKEGEKTRAIEATRSRSRSS